MEFADRITLGDLDDQALAARLLSLGVHLRPVEIATLRGTLERDPTAAELALFNSMWSEHCSYKSSRTLLASLPTQAPHVVMGPGADAGIVRLPRLDATGRAVLEDSSPGRAARCVCVGHESHNHPSQVLPFEGASTGIGGIVRDVYCMGADVIGVLDALHFGDPDGANADTVRAIVRGVVGGVAHYGNALGVPNLGGDVEFDAAFDDNCLVNVVALGILNEDEVIPSVAPQDAAASPYVMVLVGKPTDDSGLGGAAFASGALDAGDSQRGAVQLPDPFFKRVLTIANRAVIAHLRAHGAPFAIKDLGAAGLGGVSSEMVAGAGLGLDLDLDAVHADRPDRPAAVLLVAETQERYALVVPESVAAEVCAIYERDFELGHMVRGAGARVIGQVLDTARYRATRSGRVHVDVPTRLITEPPRIEWPHAPRPVAAIATSQRSAAPRRDLNADCIAMLESRALAARHGVYAHFDCDVQGRTLLRPGDADAGVVVPWRDEPLGIAVGLGGASRWGRRDAWRAGAAAVCEAARNVAAVGATPWALTDCINHGSPETPHSMQDLADVVAGLGDAARGLGVRGHAGAPLPFVSGNVSLYNESRSGSAIPPTPIVACFGVLCDVSTARGMRFKAACDVLYRLGKPQAALGASLFAQVVGDAWLVDTAPLPELDLVAERACLHAVLDAFAARCVRAAHDLGDGGLACALIEMCLGRDAMPRFGVQCDLDGGERSLEATLFGEATGFVCAVPPEDASRFEAICAAQGVAAERLGTVDDVPRVRISIDGARRLDLDLHSIAHRWHTGLDVLAHGGVLA